MKIMYRFLVSIVPMLLFLAVSARAQLITLDPDNYADGTILNTVIPGLSVTTAGSDNLPIPPVTFDVTAKINTSPFAAPTGDKVFAHVGIPFWNDGRRLRMNFDGVVSSVSIAFMGSTPLASEQGRLEVYGTNGELLGSYTTQPLFGGQIETMAFQRALPDIAWAVAYTLPGQSVFGKLDHLVFSQPVPVPEPATLSLLSLAVLALLLRFRVQR